MSLSPKKQAALSEKIEKADRQIRPSRFSSVIFMISLFIGVSSFLFVFLLGSRFSNNTIILQYSIYANLVAIFVLGLLISLQIFRLVKARRERQAATNLYLRIISLFTLVSVVPVIIVSAFSLIVLNEGPRQIYSARADRLSASIESIAIEYISTQNSALRAELVGLTASLRFFLNREERNDTQINQFISEQANIRALSSVAITDNDGNALYLSSTDNSSLFRPPPVVALNQALENNQVVILTADAQGQYGALIPLSLNQNRVVLITRRLNPKARALFNQVDGDLNAFKNIKQDSRFQQFAFFLMYSLLVLMVLFSAVWLGLSLTGRIVFPIHKLIRAASRIKDGELGAQVEVDAHEDDMSLLADTFNTMSLEIRDQQNQLLQNTVLLNKRRQFTEAVLSGVSSGVLGCNSHGKIILANEMAHKNLRISAKKTLIGMSVSDIIPEIEESLPKKGHTRQQTLSIPVLVKGEDRHFRIRFQILGARGSRSGEYIVTFDDITDLMQAQKRSAWGDVARRIAHEIKNPLTPIQLATERLSRRYRKLVPEDDTVFDQCTKTIIRQVGDLQQMVDEFSSFARMPKAQLEVRDISVVLREVLDLQELGKPEHIKFDIEIPDIVLNARLDEQLFSQMIINLVKNGFEAIERNKELGTEEAQLLVRLQEQADGRRAIEIIDSGIGWPAENRNQLLEPYVTTRDKGSGLGLAIVSRIMEDHEGSIELLDAAIGSKPNGACVKLLFPEISSVSVEM